MLHINPHKQSPSRCGPASLKMVLEHFGVNKTEEEIARAAKTTEEFGTSAPDLLEAARVFGFDGFIKDGADIADLREWVTEKKIPVIVAWFSHDDGHYSVVTRIDEVDNGNISIADPEEGAVRTLPIADFMRVWFDFRGPMMQMKDDIVIRRMIVIYPK